ncbi:MAG: mshA 1 [Lacunisphaera sp.]|jgi:glycosyltransferase involved in cell wall biosynthesis|nr:mshA 1 [Lacunisphaera sp.]
MIYYDTTKMGAAKHRSGLMRLTSRIREELGGVVTPVTWAGGFRDSEHRKPIEFQRQDWLLTVEQFSEAERPGFTEFVRHPPCRLAAIFHDAIPVKFPHITWPQSVQRHPEYMKLLAGFDRTWAISEATRRDFTGFWRWQGVTPKGPTEVIMLGADFDGEHRRQRDPIVTRQRPSLLSVGIVEPRKNQTFLLEVAEALWRDGLDFELHIVGRVNPHFGKSIRQKMQVLQQREERFHFHAQAGDRELARLYAAARAVAFPTMAEGCGLPLLEALWRGVPCVGSDLPVLRENAGGGGCLLARVNDAADWAAKLRTVLTDEGTSRRLQAEAMARPLPRWTDTAQTLRCALL